MADRPRTAGISFTPPGKHTQVTHWQGLVRRLALRSKSASPSGPNCVDLFRLPLRGTEAARNMQGVQHGVVEVKRLAVDVQNLPGLEAAAGARDGAEHARQLALRGGSGQTRSVWKSDLEKSLRAEKVHLER